MSITAKPKKKPTIPPFPLTRSEVYTLEWALKKAIAQATLSLDKERKGLLKPGEINQAAGIIMEIADYRMLLDKLYSTYPNQVTKPTESLTND